MVSVSGCRGVVGASMTPATVSRYVGAVAAWLKSSGGAQIGQAVALGRDGRRGGDVMHQAAAAELRASGFRVVDLGVVTTPTVGVAINEHGAAGGLVITASHNPAQWNGLKPITSDGRGPSPESAAKIVQFFTEHTSSHVAHDKLGSMEADGAATHSHVSRVLKAVERVAPVESIRAKKFKIAVDSVNASGAAGARMLLEALNCELVHLYADDSGDFPHAPEPTRENLSGAGGLADAVRDEQCAVGFAQDPDADRLAILDERGEYIGEEYTLVIATEAILGSSNDANGATLAANLSTSRMIDDVAAKHGARVLRTPVGEAHVAEALAKNNGVIGGEGNGGVIWPDVVMIRDSLGAMALTLALMTRTGQSISEFVNGTPAYAIVKRKAELSGDATQAVEAVAAHWKAARIDRQDGVRVDLDDQRAWLHVRASNTEPILRLIAEAPDEAAANAILDEAESTIP